MRFYLWIDEDPFIIFNVEALLRELKDVGYYLVILLIVLQYFLKVNSQFTPYLIANLKIIVFYDFQEVIAALLQL